MSDEDDERQAEAVAQLDEPGALLTRRGVEAAAEVAGLVGDHADRRAVDAGEADDEVARPARRELEQRAGVDQAVGSRRARRRPRGLGRAAVRPGRRRSGAAGGASGSGPPTTEGRWASRSRTTLGRGDVVVGHEVGDAVGAWTRGPPSSSAVDLLARDRLDHARAGEEQPRVAGPPSTIEVAERGRVGGAARARARDDGDLRHARGGLRAEDRRVGGQRRRALLQARAARVREADDGRAGAVGRARWRARSSRRRRAPSEPPRSAPSCAQRTPAGRRRARARHDAVADRAAQRAERARGRSSASSRGASGSLGRLDGRVATAALMRSCRRQDARHAFWPPNPNEFDSASFRPGASRGPSGT